MNTLKPLASYIFLSIYLLGCEPTEQTKEFVSEQTSSPKTAQSVIPAPQSRDFLPDFVLPTLDGGFFDSSAQEERVLLINFWATWCAPCRVEIPDLISLQEELGSDNFTVVGISLDTDEPAYVKEFVDVMKVNYPILIDDGAVAEAFGGVYALPTTFVVDKKGKVTHRTIGLFPVDAVKEELVQMVDDDSLTQFQ